MQFIPPRIWLPLLGVALFADPIFAQSPQDAPAAAQPGVHEAEITFSQTPVENGIAASRDGIVPTPDGWMAKEGSEPTQPWRRTFRLKVTDPWFQNGAHPVVDIDITYRVSAIPAILGAKADTQNGAEWIAKPEKTLSTQWQTRRLSLSNAYFGARSYPKDGRPSLSGFDLLLNIDKCDFFLRSVRLIGYDLDKDVSWTRLLNVGDPVNVASSGVLLFPRKPGQQINVPLQNLAHIPCSLHYELQVSDFQDQTRKIAGTFPVPAGGSATLPLQFDTTAWPLGPYEATLNLFEGDQADKSFYSRKIRLGIVSDTNLDKARPGEFLYGLDPANNGQFPTHSPAAYAYYRLMGVDILRNLWNNDMKMTVENAGRALSELASQGVQSMIIVVPPNTRDSVARAAALQQTDAFLKELATRYAGTGPGKLHYYELGNEPDLTGFFSGPMSEYLDCFYSMRDAIKQGAMEAGLPDSSTAVMNGGLAFVHPAGVKHSLEFISLLDPARIDIIAYHGHGPGIASERNAYQRIYNACAKVNKTEHPFLETESGMIATDRPTLIDQARTAVEKEVFAQSVGSPSLMFFRLFMAQNGEAGYGMTEHTYEPRPVILSYRAMVERLRHHVFVKTLDFASKAGARNVDGFLFEERDASGRPTGHKVALAFCEKLSKAGVLLRLSAPGAAIGNMEMHDVFGNPMPPKLVAANIASFTVGPDPVYLSWSSAGGSADVDVVRPLLRADSIEPLLIGAGNSATITVYNPSTHPMAARLTIAAHARAAVRVEPMSRELSLEVDKPVAVPLKLDVGEVDAPLRLPKWWKVFHNIQDVAANAGTYTTIPDQIAGPSGPDEGEFVWTPDNRIDFAKLAGTYSEKRPGLAYAEMDSPRALVLPCSASADYWMQWYVNGQLVCDTMAAGNGANTSVGSHPFDLPLRAGRNLIAVLVRSGKGGWALDYAGPKERGLALSGGVDPDRLTVTLEADGQNLTQQDISLILEEPVPPLGTLARLDDAGAWMTLEPLAVLDSTSIHNPWLKEPDQSRWYSGKDDLSGIVCTRDDGSNLQIFVNVTDDKLVQAPSADKLAQYDSLRLVIADDAGKPLVDLITGLVNGAPALAGEPKASSWVARIEKPGSPPVTVYRITVPKSLLGTTPIRLNLQINDNDTGYLKQTMDLGDVSKPQDGQRLILRN